MKNVPVHGNIHRAPREYPTDVHPRAWSPENLFNSVKIPGQVKIPIPIPKFPWELGMRTAGPVGVERWVVSCEEARSAFGELYKALWHSAACLPEVLHESGVVAAVLARVCSFEPHLLLLSKIFSSNRRKKRMCQPTWCEINNDVGDRAQVPVVDNTN